MTSTEPPEPVRAWVARQVNVPAETPAFSLSPTGRFNQTWHVSGTPRPLVLRIAPPDDPDRQLFYEYRMMRREPGIHQIVRENTQVKAPEILGHETLLEGLGRDVILMERLTGGPLSEHPGLTPAALDAILQGVGRWIRETHEIRGSKFGYPAYIDPHGHSQGPMPQKATWQEAFSTMWDLLLDDLEACGGYEKHEAQTMRQFLARSIDLFDGPRHPSLLHMDVWAENILVDDTGQLTGLIDWDRALWGDPETEFAVLDYCGVSEPAFWEGYGRPDPRQNDPRARVRRVFYLLYEIQKYVLIQLARHENPAGAERYKRESFRLAQSLW